MEKNVQKYSRSKSEIQSNQLFMDITFFKDFVQFLSLRLGYVKLFLISKYPTIEYLRAFFTNAL